MNLQPGPIKDACIKTSEDGTGTLKKAAYVAFIMKGWQHDSNDNARVTDCQRLSDDPACTHVNEVGAVPPGDTSFLPHLLW